MPNLEYIHHTAIICSDYAVSRRFYTHVLGLKVLREHFRSDRNSYKLDLCVGDRYAIELFSFPNPPPRLTQPEACGLRHLAFAVVDLDQSIAEVSSHGVQTEAIRTDEFTGKRFTFLSDPDGLPIELYEK